MAKHKKIKVLFLCTGNSVRSQMAEGFARHYHSRTMDAYSAGVAPTIVHPYTLAVMKEAGVDMEGHRSKHVREFLDFDIDLVITVCSYADSVCPSFPKRTKTIHIGFDDPSKFMREGESVEETMGHFRKVRNEIDAFIKDLPKLLAEKAVK